MACVLQAPCGGLMVPDHAYNHAMAQQGLRRRQGRCYGAGHTLRYLSRAGLGGRPKEGRIWRRHCAVCHVVFERYVVRSHTPPRACSPRCRALLAARRTARLTPCLEARARERYRHGQSMEAIAAALGLRYKAVRLALVLGGVEIRSPHRRAAERCRISRCAAPVEKQTNGRGYRHGTLCRAHQQTHRAARRRRRAAVLGHRRLA